MTDVVDGALVGNKVGKKDKVMTNKVMTENVVVKGASVGDWLRKADKIITDSVIEDGASVGDKVGKLRKEPSSSDIASLLFDSSFAVRAKLWSKREGGYKDRREATN